MLRLRSLWPALPACVLLALLLADIGCDQEETSCPQIGDGRIEGYVLGGDGPIQANVTAYAYSDEGPDIRVDADTDSAGYYELPVPSGRFIVKLFEHETYTSLYHAAAGMALDEDLADTVSVQGAPVRVDFVGGGITVELDTPPAVESEDFYLYVQSLSQPENDTSHGTTARDGRVTFHFPLLPPGQYAMRVGQYRGEFWLPRGDRASADTIEVVAEQTTSYAARLPSPAYILGSVRGCWQALGVSPPSVAAYRSAEERDTYAEVDSTGAFTLELFAPGPVRLRVSGISGPRRWVGGADFAQATVFDVDTAETITDVSIVDSGISCQLEPPPQEGLSIFMVSLWDGDGRQLLESEVFIGDPIPICNLVPGAYRLEITPYGSEQHWFSQFYDGVDSLSAATPIVISTEGEVVSITLHLSVSGWISGRVFQSDGTDAPYRTSVFISPADDSSQISLATHTYDTWGHAGLFTIPRLHTGDYKVGARIGSAPATWYPGTADWDSAGVIHVVEGSEVSGIEWQLIE